MTEFGNVIRSAVLLLPLAGGAPALAVFFNPFAADHSLIGRIPKPGTNDPYKPVGSVNGSVACTGTLVHTNVVRNLMQPADPWVLTAGHCMELTADDSMSFRPRGRYQDTNGNPANFMNIAAIDSDRARSHPGGSPSYDVGLFRLSPTNMDQRAAIAAAGTFGLRRTPAVAQSDSLTLVGVGQANMIANEFQGTTGDKRWMRASVTSAAIGRTTFTLDTPGDGSPMNPTRHICPGDSGGPALSVGGPAVVVAGVASSAFPPNGMCNGTVLSQTHANVSEARIHNYVDSYTQRSIFWENLRIGGSRVDGFESSEGDSYGATNPTGVWALVPSGERWGSANVANHPRYGNISAVLPEDDSFRYFSAIGTKNNGDPELFRRLEQGGSNDNESLGAVMLQSRPSVLARDFEVTVPASGMITIEIDRRFNSLLLAEDFGAGLTGGAISWSGVTRSAGDLVDDWKNKSLTLNNLEPGLRQIRVYLLQVPEPSAVLLFLAGVAAWVSREHRHRHDRPTRG